MDTSHTLLVGMKTGLTTTKVSTEVYKNKAKLKIFDPPLGIYLKDCNSTYHRDNCEPVFTAVLYTVVKPRNQPQCPPTKE